MSETITTGLIGFGFFFGGIIVLLIYDWLAKESAEKHGGELWGFNYSEEYFRNLYFFCGLFCIAAGIIAILSALKFPPEYEQTKRNISFGLVGAIFIGAFIYIIYVNWRFGYKYRQSKKNGKDKYH